MLSWNRGMKMEWVGDTGDSRLLMSAGEKSLGYFSGILWKALQKTLSSLFMEGAESDEAGDWNRNPGF